MQQIEGGCHFVSIQYVGSTKIEPKKVDNNHDCYTTTTSVNNLNVHLNICFGEVVVRFLLWIETTNLKGLSLIDDHSNVCKD